MKNIRDIYYQLTNRIQIPKSLKRVQFQYTIIILSLIIFYSIFVAISLIQFKETEVQSTINEIRKSAYKNTDSFNLYLKVLKVNSKKHQLDLSISFFMGDTLKRNTESQFPSRKITYFFNTKKQVKLLKNNWRW
ncbi:hypothetical protein K502DRAFT_185011 [Neoconidiobolus thromboides FSU 785]|nr:hypothetical protein K502DRAFT_185011 [Neoconidiobolus thromboides FSU 785]